MIPSCDSVESLLAFLLAGAGTKNKKVLKIICQHYRVKLWRNYIRNLILGVLLDYFQPVLYASSVVFFEYCAAFTI